MGMRAIARETGLSRNTVRGWLASGRPPTWRKGERPSIVDPFVHYLHRRLTEGCRNATRLWHEIRDQGFQGKVVLVRAWVGRIKAGDPSSAPRPAAPVWRRPSARQATRMLLSRAELPEMDAAFVAALRGGEIGAGAELARRFAAMVRERDAAALEQWLEDARDGPLAGFAESLRRDRAAVEAALTLPWSTGPVEGKITKLKLVKRSMYGRAGVGLLRQRMLAA
jgi:transposase